MPYPSQSEIARFWSKVDKTPGHGPWGDCWIWIGGTVIKGRGYFSLGRKLQPATRVVWLIERKEYLGSLYALHKCDNKMCVNPSHLFSGNQLDNMKDMASKGRNSVYKLKDEDIYGIRKLKGKLSQSEIAEIFGVSQGQVCRIINHNRWSHID